MRKIPFFNYPNFPLARITSCLMLMNVTMHMKKFAGFFLGAAITKLMKKQVEIVLDEIKIYAETGEVSEAKKNQ